MQWKWLFFEPNKIFDCFFNQTKFFNLTSYRKTKQKQKRLKGRRVLLNLKTSKNRGICKNYNKLFVRNYF